MEKQNDEVASPPPRLSRALRLNNWMNKASKVSLWASAVLILFAAGFFCLSGFLTVLSYAFHLGPTGLSNSTEWVLTPAIFLLLFAAGCTLARLIVSAIFFCKFSLRQIIVGMITINALIALTVLLPGDLSTIPIFVLLSLCLCVGFYINSQRPGFRGMPGFVAEAERRKRLAAIRKKFGR